MFCSIGSISWLAGRSDKFQSSKSGRFQLESGWISTFPNMDARDMASIPMDSASGQKIVIVVGKISDPKSSGIVGGFLHTVTSYLGNGEPPYFILVYDTDAQKVLTRAVCDGSPQTVTISRNGEFALLSYGYRNPGLWRLVQPGSSTGSWGIQCVHEYSSGGGSGGRACFGGDSDEWVILANRAGVLNIWAKHFSHPCQVIEGLHKSFLSIPVAIYCPANEKSGTPRLLCGHNTGEVVIWKWWKKSPK